MPRSRTNASTISLPTTLRVYRRLSAMLAPVAPLLIKRRLKNGKEDPARTDERRGISAIARPDGPLVWIHGASVGEVLAAAALIERLRVLGFRILLTSGTVTSAGIVAKRFPADIIHQYIPYDSPRFVARFLDHWRPSLALFIESDLWPNLILAGHARRLPMVLINGRMSQRSFPRWQKFSATIGALLGRFDICLAQSDTDAERFGALGSRNVVITGNLKLDVAAPPADPAKLETLVSATTGRPVIVASSTHPGEEEILAATHKDLAGFFPGLLTVIVPRHAHRGEAIAKMIGATGAQIALRSRDELPDATTDIYVADTMGELGLFYRLSPIVFMGRLAGGPMAGKTRSRRSSSAPLSSTARTCSTSPTSMRRSTAPAVPEPPMVRKLWSGNSAICSAMPAHGKSRWTPALLSSSSSAARWSARSARCNPISCRCSWKWDRAMREPAFWHRPSSLLSRLLLPLAAVYGEVAATRMKKAGVEVGIPVFCVGNYHVGGAGKTQTALALVALLRELGETPIVLSRGYGGSLRGPVKVDPARHHAADVGDEPLMMARHVPVVIARDRVDGAALARSTNASVIVMDDGFQNPAVAKDMSLIVIDGDRGLGNGRVLPAGPLRAPLDVQLARSDALVIVGNGRAADAVAKAIFEQGGPVWRAQIKPNAASVAALEGKRVLAFCGIGDPGRFFRTLKASGIDVVVERALADHHPYTLADIDALRGQARRDGLTLVTTEKDLVKLRGLPGAQDIVPFAVTLAFDDTAELNAFVLARLNKARTNKFRA